MFIAAGVILFGVTLLYALALYGRNDWRGWLAQERVAIIGGVAFPVVTLSALLSYSLIMTSRGSPASGVESPIKISVVGERWWWRVSYQDGEGRSFESPI
jgi:cytochrome c oxidase subunit 2